MVAIITSGTFGTWLANLRDKVGQARIADRIVRLGNGNPGDHKGIGDGIMELRMTFGPGYRVYYMQKGSLLIVLLAGGDKSSQAADIAKAKSIAAEWNRK